jgi:hypothetical protein
MENTERQNLPLVKKRKTTFSQKETFTLLEQAREDTEVSAKFTKIQQKMLYNLERRLGIVAYAARDTGINRHTHYKWLTNNPDYRRMVELLNELLLDYAESRLLSFIKRNDFRAIMYLLQTKGKNRGYSRYWKKIEETESHSDMIINLTSLKDAEILAKMLGSWKNIRVNGVESGALNNEHGI